MKLVLAGLSSAVIVLGAVILVLTRRERVEVETQPVLPVGEAAPVVAWDAGKQPERRTLYPHLREPGPVELGTSETETVSGLRLPEREPAAPTVDLGSRRERVGVEVPGGDGAPALADGLHTSWHREGVKAAEGLVENGRRVGSWTEWHANGRKAVQGEYLAGEKHGLWSEWHQNGMRGRVATYREGELAGLERSWYSNGRPERTGEWSDGKPHGPWTTWWEEGQLQSRGSFLLGARQGRWIFYDPGGEVDVEQSGSYEQGQRVGG